MVGLPIQNRSINLLPYNLIFGLQGHVLSPEFSSQLSTTTAHHHIQTRHYAADFRYSILIYVVRVKRNIVNDSSLHHEKQHAGSSGTFCATWTAISRYPEERERHPNTRSRFPRDWKSVFRFKHRIGVLGEVVSRSAGSRTGAAFPGLAARLAAVSGRGERGLSFLRKSSLSDRCFWSDLSRHIRKSWARRTKPLHRHIFAMSLRLYHILKPRFMLLKSTLYHGIGPSTETSAV